MGETVVGGCRKNVLAGGELLDGTKALKLWRIDDGRMGCRNQDVAMDFIANDPVSTVQIDLASNRFFIALLGQTRKMTQR